MATILVVDDEPDARTVLKMLLMLEGHDVFTASDGVEALAVVGRQQPDIVITDWMMPRMNGRELTRRLREQPDTRSLPVIAASALGVEPQHDDRSYDRFLRKPFDLEELRRTIDSLLDGRRAS